jgi:hypothetical protein
MANRKAGMDAAAAAARGEATPAPESPSTPVTPSTPTFPIRRVVSTSPGLSESKPIEPTPVKTLTMSEFIAQGGRLSEEDAKALKVKSTELKEAPSETSGSTQTTPTAPKMGVKAKFKAQKAAEKAPKESQADSAYEENLRRNMPFPGAKKATKSQEEILTSSAAHLGILTDHWNKVQASINNNTSHPAFATHAEVGARLSLAAAYLRASRLAKGKNQNVSHEHMKTATDALHDANKMMWNSTPYSIVAGDNPPLGTAATDVNRAHALVEFPTRKEYGRLSEFVKIGRGTQDIKGSQISSKVENSQQFFERLEQMKSEMNHPDPAISGRHAGTNRGLFAAVSKLAARGTPRGGDEWSQTNLGPQSLTGKFGVGNLVSSYGVGNDIQNISQGSNFDTSRPTELVKTKVPLVKVHSSPLPADADIVRHKVTKQTWASVNGQVVDKMPEEKDARMVPFGQHTNSKVVDKFGREVPHVDEKGRLLSLRNLRKAGAEIQDTIKYLPAPSSPNAPAPRVSVTPSTPRKLTAKELNEQSRRERLKSENKADIERAQNDLSDAIENAWTTVQQRKLEKKPRTTKSKNNIINIIGQDISKSSKKTNSKGKGN